MLNLTALEKEITEYEHSFNDFITLKAPFQEKKKSLCSELISENSLWQLQRYNSNNSAGRPLLITYALLNNPSILDLSPERSFIGGLIDAGFDIYLLSWKSDLAVSQIHSYHEYIINQGLSQAIDVVLTACNQPQLELLGVCQGGVFSLCLSLLEPEKIKRLILMGTPVDFHTADNKLTAFVKQLEVIKNRFEVAQPGNVINSQSINRLLSYQRPAQLLMLKYANFINLAHQDQDEFYQLEKWLWDSGWLSVAALRQFIDDFYTDNKLILGTLSIKNQQLDLADLAVPTLNIYAENDRLVPPSASTALGDKINTGYCDYQTFGFKTGHIGLYVSRKVQSAVIDTIAMPA